MASDAKTTDIAEAGAIVDIPNLGKRLRAPDDMRYRYPAGKCPSCGGVGIPWRGWFNCDGPADCDAKAWIATGEVFLPVPPPPPDPTAGLLLCDTEAAHA